MSFRVLAIALACISAAAVPDPSPPPCSLNGRLNPTSLACDCIPRSGWVGPSCNTLSLLPAVPLDVSHQAYCKPHVENTWGISVIAGDVRLFESVAH